MEKGIVYFGEKKIPCPENITFYELKRLILKLEKRLVLLFTYNNEIINESYLVREYTNFIYEMDPNIFIEFSKGKFRCRLCRKYVKKIKLKCPHTQRCKALYKFKKIEFIKCIEGKYEEDMDLSIDRILKKLDKKIEEEKMRKIKEINDILNTP